MLNEQEYNVVYAGAIKIGFDEKAVKEAFIAQMKIPKKHVDQLFTGKRLTLKKNLTKPQAENWKKKLLLIGAETVIIPTVDVKKTVVENSKSQMLNASSKNLEDKQSSSFDSEQYDGEIDERIKKAKAMIALQRLEQSSNKKDSSSPMKKVFVFTGALVLLLSILYFYGLSIS